MLSCHPLARATLLWHCWLASLCFLKTSPEGRWKGVNPLDRSRRENVQKNDFLTYILCHCMQNSTIGNVGVEPKNSICKVAICNRTGMDISVRQTDIAACQRGLLCKKLATLSFQILETESRRLTWRCCQEPEMKAFNFLFHGHAQQAPPLPLVRWCHFHTDIPISRGSYSIQQAG